MGSDRGHGRGNAHRPARRGVYHEGMEFEKPPRRAVGFNQNGQRALTLWPFALMVGLWACHRRLWCLHGPIRQPPSGDTDHHPPLGATSVVAVELVTSRRRTPPPNGAACGTVVDHPPPACGRSVKEHVKPERLALLSASPLLLPGTRRAGSGPGSGSLLGVHSSSSSVPSSSPLNSSKLSTR